MRAGLRGHQPLPGLLAAAHRFRPLRRGHLVVAPLVLDPDLVPADVLEQLGEDLPGEVLAVVDFPVVADELVQGHLLLHLCIVLVCVQHEEAVREHVHRVGVRHGVWVLHVVPVSEDLQDARDLLRFAGQEEGLEVDPQRHVERVPFEVKKLHELPEDGHVELFRAPQQFADHVLVQARAVPQKLGHRDRLERRGQQLDPLQELQALLVVPVEVVGPDRQPLLQLLLHQHPRHPGLVAVLRPHGPPQAVGVLGRVGLGLGERRHPPLRAQALLDALHDGQQPLQAEEVCGGQRRVHREGVARQQVGDAAEDVGAVHGAVQVGVHVRHEGGVSGELHEALQGDLLLLVRGPLPLGDLHQHALHESGHLEPQPLPEVDV
mmetsp:Transcript_29327/g.81973  ORF Transcript_29327/g.81973 Transcript_29327/m.81973 type:complete len:377 (-) Transcript_29327:277-1407(-)